MERANLLARAFRTASLLGVFSTFFSLLAFGAAVNPPPSGISFTLEGCRLPDADHDGLPDYTLPLNGKVICNNQTWTGGNDDYTTGNLGKSWNELDLVPYRIIVDAGNSAPASSSFTFAAVLDGFDVGHPGYDVISNATLNPGSDAGCPAPVNGGQMTASPGLGGIDQSIYNQIDINGIAKNKTCVYDFYGRLAIGSHLFPGSSLHANLALIDPAADGGITTSGIGARDVSIPVKEISPQELSKDMSGQQDVDHSWTIQKSPTPASLNFGNVCEAESVPTTLPLSITISWTKGDGVPSGLILVTTNIYATNPAARTITVNVTDQIRSGTTTLDTASTPAGGVDVPANTTQLVLTHQVYLASSTTDINDLATATYTDKLTGIPVSGTTAASACVGPGLNCSAIGLGAELNATASIFDTESIYDTANVLDFKVALPSIGSFSGYTAGDYTTGPVDWNSGILSAGGSVSFAKTVRINSVAATTGHLVDTATLTGANGFTASASADVTISASALGKITITKIIPNVLQAGDADQSFTFHVFDAANTEVAAPTITFSAGGATTQSVDVTGLALGTYTVSEDDLAGWQHQNSQGATVSAADANCATTVTFTNVATPAKARVKKVTSPAGFEGNWTFKLYKGATLLETITTSDASFALFSSQLGEGSYSIVEVAQNGWSSDGGSGCTFDVNLPADANKTFSCTYTNTYSPSVQLTKSCSPLSKIGDTAYYGFSLVNTGLSGGAAGVPSLVCSISDPTIGYSITGQSLPFSASNIPFVIPVGASDPFPNTATANCTYPGLATVVATSQDSCSINLFQPSVKLTKTASNAYSKAGDTVTYSIKIENTSSADSPNLILASFADTLVSGVTPVASCNSLAPGLVLGASCEFSYTYVVQPGDADPLLNTATVHYHPDGFPNDIWSSDSKSVDLLHPQFSMTKVCKSQPVPQAGPAVFTIAFNNTGDADLHVVPDEGVPFDVAAGSSYSYDYSVSGPFSATVNNTVNATVTLASKYNLSNSYTANASGSCTVSGSANVSKTVNGGAPQLGQVFTFQLRSGASTVSDGTILEQKNTSSLGTLSFNTALVPGQTYQICELVMVGWNTSLTGDGPLFVPNSIIPPALPNPNVNNLPVCVDFSVASGETRTFTVDNTAPGGRALTIGFWKNWASCSNSKGGQKPVLDQTLALANVIGDTTDGHSTLPGIVLSATSGSYWLFGPTYYLVVHGSTATPNAAPDCSKAVNLLNKSTVNTGKKMASDPLFNMTAQLLAAEINLTGGAGVNGAVLLNINRAVLLNGKYHFNGNTHMNMSAADISTANCLATQLDNFNNNNPNTICP